MIVIASGWGSEFTHTVVYYSMSKYFNTYISCL